MQVQTVAAALDLHPFIFSRWRKQVRDGVLRGALPAVQTRTEWELRRLQVLEREHAPLRETHALPQRAIRFCSTQQDPGPAQPVPT